MSEITGYQRCIFGSWLSVTCLVTVGVLAAGCSGGGEDCDSHFEKQCVEGQLYWFDSCGEAEELIEQCACGCKLDGSACADCDCVPDCQDRACGPDPVCGTVSCGTCESDETCNEQGQCEGGTCTPDCARKECGPDGCGGSCGTCEQDQFCSPLDWQCKTESECVTQAYKGCYPDIGTEGADVRWFDSCGRPEEIVEDCPDLHGTCLLDENDLPECGCSYHWEGYECDVCPPEWGGPDCNSCEGKTICREGDVWACGADGMSYEFAQDCPRGCYEGACVECTSDCTGKECGDDGCGGSCGTCDAGYECDNGTCVEASDCECEDLHGWIEGVVLQFPPSNPPTPVGTALAAVNAMPALTDPDPPHLTETTSDPTTGAYKTDCFDMTEVALAIIMLVDDAGFDGTDGDLYPTYAGVAEIGGDDDKTCIENAPPAWAVSNQLVGILAQVPALSNIQTDGFAVVLVLDANEAPVAGAVLKKADDTDLATVVYPNADLSAFDGTETSANGLALVPGPLTLTSVKAVKTGMTWEAGTMAVVQGFCFTWLLIANE